VSAFSAMSRFSAVPAPPLPGLPDGVGGMPGVGGFQPGGPRPAPLLLRVGVVGRLQVMGFATGFLPGSAYDRAMSGTTDAGTR
jgi:hypothetical protein